MNTKYFPGYKGIFSFPSHSIINIVLGSNHFFPALLSYLEKYEEPTYQNFLYLKRDVLINSSHLLVIGVD